MLEEQQNKVLRNIVIQTIGIIFLSSFLGDAAKSLKIMPDALAFRVGAFIGHLLLYIPWSKGEPTFFTAICIGLSRSKILKTLGKAIVPSTQSSENRCNVSFLQWIWICVLLELAGYAVGVSIQYLFS